MDLFGEQSLSEIIALIFTIILSFSGLVAILYSLKRFLEKAKLKLYPSDRIRIVISSKSATETPGIFNIDKFHVGCNLVNPTNKLAVLHYLEAEIINEQETSFLYTWHIFYEYEKENGNYQKSNDVHPISVAPLSNALVFVEFKADSLYSSFQNWSEKYKIRLKGWVNRENRKDKPNLESEFHILISQQDSSNWTQGNPGSPNIYPVKVEEWIRT